MAEHLLEAAPAILFSNGLLPSSDFDHENSTSARILRKRSNNPQHENNHRNDSLVVKHQPTSPDENKAGLRFAAQPRSVYSESRPASHARARRPFRPRIDEEKFRYLWDRLYLCERYRKYRGVYEVKDVKGNKIEEDKWPLEHEEAYFRAIVRWPPVGRKKFPPSHRGGRPLPAGVKAHPLGRNELIALFINDWFGFQTEAECIPRKKISSHNQVLYPYFKSDPWVQWQILQPKGAKPPRHNILPHDNASKYLYEVPPSYALLSLPRMLPQLLPHAPNVLPSQIDPMDDTGSLQPHEFRMYIQHPRCHMVSPTHDCITDKRRCDLRTLHTISRSQQSHFPPKRLGDVRGWLSHLPHLEQLHRTGRLNCEIFLADSSLALAVEQIRDSCTLAIENYFRLEAGVACTYEWQCRTQIFEGGELVGMSDDADTKNDDEKQIRPVEQSPVEQDNSLLNVALRSGYWAEKFHALAARLRAATFEATVESNGKPGGSVKDALRKAEEDVRSIIKGITIMQEIFMVDSTLREHRRCVKIMYWKFRQTHRDEIGITTWRTLIPPDAEPANGQTQFGATVQVEGGLDTSAGLLRYSLPPAGAVLRSQSSYETPSQADFDLLTSTTLLGTSAYEIDGFTSQQESQSPEARTMDSNDHIQDFSFTDAFPFTMPVVPSSHVNATDVGFHEPFNSFDYAPVDAEMGSFWRPTHTDNGVPLPTDHLYALTRRASGYRPSDAGLIQKTMLHEHQKQSIASVGAEPLGFSEHHQHFHHHISSHEIPGVDAMLESNNLEPWHELDAADLQHQYLADREDASHLKYRQNLMHEELQLVQTYEENHGLQQPILRSQAQQDSVPQQSTHSLLEESHEPFAEEQIPNDPDFDWELIIPQPLSPTAAGALADTGTSLQISAQQQRLMEPRQAVRTLLPSVFEE